MAKYKINTDLDNEVKKYMKDVLIKLELDGKIDESWTAGLNMMAENYNTFVECQRAIKKDGLLITNRFGDLVANPLIQVSKDAGIQLQKLLIEFLLTKKSVIKLPVSTDAESEEFDVIKSFAPQNNTIEKR